jgi:protein O-GlcNAc transferase
VLPQPGSPGLRFRAAPEALPYHSGMVSPVDTAPDAQAPRPSSAAEWARLGQRQLQAGGLDAAIASFQNATQLDASSAEHWLRLGRAQAAKWQHAAAESALRRACALAPGSALLHVALADVLLQQNKAEAALEACLRAVAAEPDNIHAAVAEALLLPPVYADADDLEAWRYRFIDGLARLHARQERWLLKPRGVLGVEANNFYLAYQGEDDLALQASYSDFLAGLLGAAVPELHAPIEPRRERGARIRVGFLSSNLKVSTVGDYFGSWITDLPRDRFEICSILAAGIPDARTETLARASDRFASVNGSADEIARSVKALELDVLVFLDVAMTSWGSLLANLRLAPVQCAAWGHPVTTGSAFIDCFLSCAEMEPEDAAGHYRERLVLLPGLGTRYRSPPLVENAARERLGLPESRHLYLCPQSLFKIHPDADDLYLELLARDEEAVLVFFAATTDGQRDAFARRLQEGMKMRGLPPRQQIKLLPLLSHRDFRRLMTVVDVMIDTPHWSGGSTSLSALASGLPIVTLEGRFMRGRQSAAMLRTLGVEELIARDAEHYVQLALRIARDAGYRDALSARIRAGWPRLADRSEPVEALADALAGMVDERR